MRAASLALLALANVAHLAACQNEVDVDDAVVDTAGGDAADEVTFADEFDDATDEDGVEAEEDGLTIDQALAANNATCDSNARTGDYCAGDKVSHGVAGTLYRCNGPGRATRIRACSNGCVVAPPGQDDYCRAPAPRCDADARTGDYCGGDKVSHGNSDVLYRCEGPGPARVAERCSDRCIVAPPGRDDYCSDDDTCPRAALLRFGLAPRASDEFRCAGVGAGSIVQTIGNAPASAGYHARDGVIDGDPYCAATDISTRGLNSSQVRALLSRLADGGFAAFHREPGRDGWPASEARHIHAVYVGVAMKSQLRGQVSDWLNGRNGLASHGPYTFWQPSAAQKAAIRRQFNAAN